MKAEIKCLLTRCVIIQSLILSAHAQSSVVFTNLYSFGSVVDTNGIPLDGAQPLASLVQGSDGSFYGTTSSGGTNGGGGSVFKIGTNGTLTSLYSFTGTNDGNRPNGLVQGSDGNFYGTMSFGDASGEGTVFQVTPAGVLTTLVSF